MQPIPVIQDILKLRRESTAPRRRQDNITIALFLLPSLVLFLLFVIYPIFRAVYFSMFNWNGLGPATKFVGAGNFISILTDQVFLIALKNGLIIITLSLALQLPIALGFAVLVSRDLPGRALFRTIFFMPYVLSEVNTAIMWMLLYNADPDQGLLNAILRVFHIAPVDWMGDTNVVLFAVFFALTWKYFGFHMLLYLTGLQNIPREVEESGTIDGANAFQNFFYITLPLLRSTIRTSGYLSVLVSLQQFILVWVLTKGGPVKNRPVVTPLYKY